MTESSPEVQPLRALIGASLDAHEVVAASLGLNGTDLRCLELASREPEMTPSRLAEISGLTSGAITGVLDRLERAGFATREADAADRRRVLVRLDPARLADVEERLVPLLADVMRAGADAVPEMRERAGRYLSAVAEALERETGRLRVATHGGFLEDEYLAPRGDISRARFVLHTGAPRLNVGAAAFGQQLRMVAETAATRLVLTAAEPGDELIRADFVGPAPDVRTVDGTVTMRYRRRMIDTRSRTIRAGLHPGPAWTIEIDDGITDLDADLRGIELRDLSVDGGVNHFDLRLPRPDGTVRIAVAGGASDGRLRRPPDVPVLLIVDGVSRLTFDGQYREASGTPLRLRSRGYDRSPDRYEVEISGGISDLVIEGG